MRQFELIFRTAHGDRLLSGSERESIVDICRRYGIPVSQVTSYFADDAGELSLFVQPFTPIGKLESPDRIVVLPNRNIDYQALLGGSEIIREREGAVAWIATREIAADGSKAQVIEMLRPQDARELVTVQVREALELVEQQDKPLVVGVSGGGDSNALLGAIVNSGVVSPHNIRPVMMLGIPDWDKGADRALAICAEYGLEITFVEEKETARILGFADAGSDWVTSFEQAFPGDDLEVLGVYGVRKVLEAVARREGAQRIVIGSNLEDCLSDVFYYLCGGRVPFPKPCGRMGEVEVLYPLWLTPKAVIDGCYPAFSRANYEARYPSRMFGRAYFYYLAQMMVDAYPGAAQDILRGAGKLSATHHSELNFDEEFRTPTLAPIPFDIRIKLRRLFSGSADRI